MHSRKDVDHRRLGRHEHRSQDRQSSRNTSTLPISMNAGKDEDFRLIRDQPIQSLLAGIDSRPREERQTFSEMYTSDKPRSSLSKPAQDLISTWKTLYSSDTNNENDTQARDRNKRSHSPGHEYRPSRWSDDARSTNQPTAAFTDTKKRSRWGNLDDRRPLSPPRSSFSDRRRSEKDYSRPDNGDLRHDIRRSPDRNYNHRSSDRRRRSPSPSHGRMPPPVKASAPARNNGDNGTDRPSISFSIGQKKDTFDVYNSESQLIVDGEYGRDELGEDKLEQLMNRPKTGTSRHQYTSGATPSVTAQLSRPNRAVNLVGPKRNFVNSGFRLSDSKPAATTLLPTPSNSLLGNPAYVASIGLEPPKSGLLPLPAPSTQSHSLEIHGSRMDQFVNPGVSVDTGHLLSTPRQMPPVTVNRVLLPLPVPSTQTTPTFTTTSSTTLTKKVILLSTPAPLLPLPTSCSSSPISATTSAQDSTSVPSTQPQPARKTLLPPPPSNLPAGDASSVEPPGSTPTKKSLQLLLPSPDTLPSYRSIAFIQQADLSVAVAKVCNSFSQPGCEMPEAVVASLLERVCIAGATSSLCQLLQAISHRPKLPLLSILIQPTIEFSQVMQAVEGPLEAAFDIAWHINNVPSVFFRCFLNLNCWTALDHHLDKLNSATLTPDLIHTALDRAAASNWSDPTSIRVCIHLISHLNEDVTRWMAPLWLVCVEREQLDLAERLMQNRGLISGIIGDVEERITHMIQDWSSQNKLHLVITMSTQYPDLSRNLLQLSAASLVESKEASGVVVSRIIKACQQANASTLLAAELVLRICRLYGNRYHWQSAQNMVVTARGSDLPLTQVCLMNAGDELPALLLLIEIALSSHQPETIDFIITDCPKLAEPLIESSLAIRRHHLLRDLLKNLLDRNLPTEAGNVFYVVLTIYSKDSQPPADIDMEASYNQLIVSMCLTTPPCFDQAQSTVKRVSGLTPSLRLQPLTLRLFIVAGVRQAHQPVGQLLSLVDKALAVSIYRPIQPRSGRLAIPTDACEEEILALLLAYCRDLKDYLIQQMMSEGAQEDVLSLCELSISVYAVGSRDPEFVRRIGVVDASPAQVLARVQGVLDRPSYVMSPIEYVSNSERANLIVDSFALYNAVYHCDFD